MKDFFLNFQNELLWSGICLVLLAITRTLSIKAIKRVARISEMDRARTRLIIKYVIVGHSLLLISALTLIWGVNFRELGLIFSSVFAVIGVALFASWSILSNITAGVILFFTFPYKIGDRIRIHDKELDNTNDFFIEDIRAFHVHLRQPDGVLLTYPNNLFLQKAVSLASPDKADPEGIEAL